MNSEARYTPYFGMEYFSTGLNGQQILFIGGQHSCMLSEREDKYKCKRTEICDGTDSFDCPTYRREKEGCPLYEYCQELNMIKEYRNIKFNEAECKKRIKLTCETIYSVWDYTKNYAKRRPNFIFNSIESFRNELGTAIGEYDFYQYIAFANYVQVLTSNNKNKPELIDDKYLQGNYDEDNMKGFVSNYNYLKPHVIVVIHFEEIRDKIKNKLPNLRYGGETFVELEGYGDYYIFAKKNSDLYKSNKFSYAKLKKYHKFKINAESKGYKINTIAAAIAYHNKINNGIDYIDSYKELNEKYGCCAWKKLQSTCNKAIERMEKEETTEGKTLKRCLKELDEYFTQMNFTKR